jgi:hypothetical protein
MPIKRYPPQEQIPPYHSSDELEHEQYERSTRHKRRANRLTLVAKRAVQSVALGLAIAGGTAYGYLEQDIQEGKAEVADSHPIIHDIYRDYGLYRKHTGIYVATGLGTRDPSETARTLTSHDEIGDVYAIEYSNKDINTDEITERVVMHAREHGIKYLFFDGYSAGGPIELAVAANIYEKYDDLHVVGVALNSSPVGNDALTDKSERAAETITDVLDLWPSLVYSKKARWATEVISRTANRGTLDTGEIKHDIDDVYETKIANKKAASGSLISSEFQMVLRGVEESVRRLSKPHKDKQLPQLFYTRSVEPGSDQVVKVVNSETNFRNYMAEYRIPSTVLRIANIGHANPGERPAEYNSTFEADIAPAISEFIVRETKNSYGQTILAAGPHQLP